MPVQEVKDLDEEGKLFYYTQTLLALMVFVLVTDLIVNWFVPDFHTKFVEEWQSVGDLFTSLYASIKQLTFFIFKIPGLILAPFV